MLDDLDDMDDLDVDIFFLYDIHGYPQTCFTSFHRSYCTLNPIDICWRSAFFVVPKNLEKPASHGFSGAQYEGKGL